VNPRLVLSPTVDGIRLSVRIQPGASRTEIVGEHGGALKIRVAAPPVDGAANEALLRFLADQLGVRRAAVTIRSGASGRAKVLRVAGITPREAARRLGLLNFRQPGP
jgi:uncharacterized protein (TIGR00251 family)